MLCTGNGTSVGLVLVQQDRTWHNPLQVVMIMFEFAGFAHQAATMILGIGIKTFKL